MATHFFLASRFLHRQRGFGPHYMMLLAMAASLLLVAICAVWFVRAVRTEDFGTAALLLWLAGLAGTYAFAARRDQALVMRMPAGLALFVAVGGVTVPVSVWSQSRWLVAAVVAVQSAASILAGSRVSAWLRERILPRYPRDKIPWLLAQDRHLVKDLVRFAAVAIFAWFVIAIPPILVALVLPAVPVSMPRWMAVGLAFAATACYLVTRSRLRLLRIPPGLWVFVACAAGLALFRSQLGGPDDGSIQDIAYHAYFPALAAAFAEIVVIGLRASA